MIENVYIDRTHLMSRKLDWIKKYSLDEFVEFDHFDIMSQDTIRFKGKIVFLDSSDTYHVEVGDERYEVHAIEDNMKSVKLLLEDKRW